MFVTNTHWPDPPRANLSNTFVFAFEALRLPLRFVLTLSLCEGEGLYKIKAHLAQKETCFTPTKAYLHSKNCHFPNGSYKTFVHPNAGRGPLQSL